MTFTRAVFGRKWLYLLGIGTGLSLGYRAFQLQPPVYASSARILLERTSELTNPATPGRHDDPLDSQVSLFEQPVILQRAVDSVALSECRTLKEAADPIAVIARNLQVSRSRVPGDFIDVSYSCETPGDCKVILSAVTRAYQDWLLEKQGSGTTDIIQTIREARQQLEDDLNASRARLAEYQDRVSPPIRDAAGMTIPEKRLSDIDARRRTLIFERQQLETRLEHLKSAIARGASREALLLLANANAGADQASSSTATVRTDAYMTRLTELILERDRVLQDVGANHPSVKRIDTSIQSLRDLLYQEAGGAEGSGLKKDLLDVHVESLDERIRAYDRELARLDDMFEAGTAEVKEATKLEQELNLLQKDADARNDLLQQVTERLDAASPSTDQDTLIATITHPADDAVQVGPRLAAFLGAGGAAGFLSAMALSCLLEFNNKRLRSAAEVTQHLGLPVVGHIPQLNLGGDRAAATDARIDRSVVIHHWPMSRLAESYRAIRTAVSIGKRGQSPFVLQITSSDAGDGKSTVAANLAVAIATSGKKCLLVDGDLRHPRVHQLFGVPNQSGLSTVIGGKLGAEEAIQQSLTANLDLLTAGPSVEDPTEVLLSHRFSELIAELRDRYDVVLFDTPAVLEGTDAAAVAAHADNVLLVVRLSKQSRPRARRACETLSLLGARVQGVIVQGVGPGFPGKWGNRSLSGSGKQADAYFSEARNS